MTKEEFTKACLNNFKSNLKTPGSTNVLIQGAEKAIIDDNFSEFIQYLIEQDSDNGSKSGTKRVLGEELYAELQKFKTNS